MVYVATPIYGAFESWRPAKSFLQKNSNQTAILIGFGISTREYRSGSRHYILFPSVLFEPKVTKLTNRINLPLQEKVYDHGFIVYLFRLVFLSFVTWYFWFKKK